jgi:hypothetical protein
LSRFQAPVEGIADSRTLRRAPVAAVGPQHRFPMAPLMNLNIDPPSKVLLVAFAEVARSVAERREQKG